MAFFGGRGGPFDDPFFGDMHHQMFRQMQDVDNLMNVMMSDPFAMTRQMLGGGPMDGNNPRERMITDRPQGSRRGQLAEYRPSQGGIFGEEDMMMPFGRGPGMFGGLLGGFGNMFNQMEQMQQQALGDPNSHVFSQSTVISMDGTGEQPRVYESTQSVRKAGDVKEERKTVRDTARGVEKMSVGHHIGDKAHIIEKKRGRDGQIKEEQKFKNLKQEEAKDFDRHFTNKVQSFGRPDQSQRQAIEGHGGPIVEEADDHVNDDSHQSFTTTAPLWGQRRRTNDRRGPIIEEIDDGDDLASNEQLDGSDRKRRKGFFGRKTFDA